MSRPFLAGRRTAMPWLFLAMGWTTIAGRLMADLRAAMFRVHVP